MVRRKTFPVLRRTTPIDLNRLTTITYPTRSLTYSYDPLNNLTRAANENGTIYIGYDSRYRVSSFSDPFFYGISYNYDTAGNRTKLRLNGATYATYTYDAVNRLASLKDGANLNFVYSYDAANRLTSRSAPNGVTSSYGYDDLNRLTSLMHNLGATTLSGNLYTYNNANNISSWTTASDQRAYTYDPVDRLTGVSNFETPTESYSYDAVGNRTASQLSASYSYQPFNKLTSTASATYNYDNNGNLVSKTDTLGTWMFSYDEENRLTQVAKPSGPTVNYKYDGLGRRIQRTTTAGANERYVYDSRDALIDLNADWSVATTYLNGPGIDNHLRQTSATTGVSYFLNDQMGSTATLTDASGNPVEQESYDSFGNSASSARTRYGYTGRERDSDTGMLYYRARFYDPQLGRFMSEDPIGFSGEINLYPYVANNPANATDPSGRQTVGPSQNPGNFPNTYPVCRVPEGCGIEFLPPDDVMNNGWPNYIEDALKDMLKDCNCRQAFQDVGVDLGQVWTNGVIVGGGSLLTDPSRSGQELRLFPDERGNAVNKIVGARGITIRGSRFDLRPHIFFSYGGRHDTNLFGSDRCYFRETLAHELIHAGGVPGVDPTKLGAFFGEDDLSYLNGWFSDWRYSRVLKACGCH